MSSSEFRPGYNSCMLCARACGVDRTAGQLGFCRANAAPRVSRAALHMWEEPSISGIRGSGTIFFSGCSLGCIYCQNREISRGDSGIEITNSRLAEIMLELQQKSAHNINLVTPTHYVPSIIEAVSLARSEGLSVPVVYNTGSFDTAETVKALKDTVNIFLPDLKYYLPGTAQRLSSAPTLPQVARIAIEQMVKQTGSPRFDSEGIMLSGVIVRILLLPGHLAEAKLNVKHLHTAYGDSIYLSLMSQYTPREDLPPPLNRRVTAQEYRELVNYAISLGVKQAYTQDRTSVGESFIPPFDHTGVIKP